MSSNEWARPAGRRWLRGILAIALCLIAAVAIFFALSGPERIARKLLETGATDAGFSEFHLDSIAIMPSGRFTLSGLSLSGAIDAASPVIERISLRVREGQGHIRWLALLGLGAAHPSGEYRPLPEFIPAFLSDLSLADCTLETTLTLGKQVRCDGLSLRYRRGSFQEAELTIEAGTIHEGTGEPTLLANDVALRAQAFKISLFIHEVKACGPWGRAEVKGETSDVYLLAEKARLFQHQLSSVQGERIPLLLSDALRELRGAGVSLSAVYYPPQPAPSHAITSAVNLKVHEKIWMELFENGQGLTIRGGIEGGEIASPYGRLRWSSLPFEATESRYTLGPVTPAVELVVKDATYPIENLTLLGSGNPDQDGTPSVLTLEAPQLWTLALLLEKGLLSSPDTHGALASLPMIGDASARLSAHCQLFPFEAQTLAAEVTGDWALQASEHEPPIPLTGVIRAAFEKGHLRIESPNLHLAGGRASVQGEAVLADLEPVSLEGQFSLSDVRLEQLSPLVFSDTVQATGSLSASGSFRAEGDWRSTLQGRASVKAWITDAGYQHRRTGPMDLNSEIRWEPQGVALAPLQIALAGGVIEGTALWDGPQKPSSGSFELGLEIPSAKRLHSLLPELASFTDGTLKGQLSGAGTLSPKPAGEVHIALEAEKPVWKNTLSADSLHLSAMLSSNGLKVEELALRTGRSTARVEGLIEADRGLSGQVVAEIEEDLFERNRALWKVMPFPAPELDFAEGGSARLAGNISGYLERPQLDLDLALRRLSFRGMEIRNLHAGIGYASSTITIPAFEAVAVCRRAAGEVDACTSHFSGAITVGLEADRYVDFAVEFAPLELALLEAFGRPAASIQGPLAGSVQGRFRQVFEALEVSLGAEPVEIAGHRFHDFLLRGKLADQRLECHASIKGASGEVAQLNGTVTEDGLCRASLQVEQFELAGAPLGKRASGALTLHASGETRIPSWPPGMDWGPMKALSQELTLSARGKVASAAFLKIPLGDLIVEASSHSGVARASIQSASPRIQARLSWPGAGESARIAGEWQEFDLGRAFEAEPIPLQLLHSGSCDLEFTAGRGARGTIVSEHARVTLGWLSLLQDEPCPFVLTPGRIEIAPLTLKDPRTGAVVLIAEGGIPLATDRPGFDLSLRADALPLESVEAEPWGVRGVSGVCTFDGTITGPLEDPSYTGRLSLSQGRFRLPLFRQALSDIKLEAVAGPEKFRLERFEGRIGLATVSASGEARLLGPGRPFLDGTLQFQNLRYAEIENLVLAGDGALRLYGPVDSATLGGRMTLLGGSYTPPFDWRQILFGKLGRRYPSPPRTPLWNPNLDIEIDCPGNFWLRNNFLIAELEGEARLRGTLERPTLTGQVSARKGAFQLNRGRFSIRRAIAVFDESRPFFPYFLISGDSRLSGYAIRARISGTPDGVQLQWSSSPPLSEGQIVSLLLTGSVPREGEQTQSASAAWLLAQGVGPFATADASHLLPVESLELRPALSEDDSSPELIAEARLSERFTVRQSVDIQDTANPSLGADYRLSENLSLTGRTNWRGDYIIELLYEILF